MMDLNKWGLRALTNKIMTLKIHLVFTKAGLIRYKGRGATLDILEWGSKAGGRAWKMPIL